VTILLNYHIGRIVLGSMHVGVSVWLIWSGIHVAGWISDINIPIIRSLRLFCWITTLVVLFLVRCVLEFRCVWVGVVSVLRAEASACNTDTTPTQPHRNSTTHRTKNNTTNVVIQQNSHKLRVAGWSFSLLVSMLQPATRIPLRPNHTETPTHIKPRTIRPMW